MSGVNLLLFAIIPILRFPTAVKAFCGGIYILNQNVLKVLKKILLDVVYML
jgi:hypothetical protein